MHVIAKSALVAFWDRHPPARAPLLAWFRVMESVHFVSFNGLRSVFPGAEYVKGLTVFNIGGNKYRLIAAIHYNHSKVFIQHVFTNEEYDSTTW